MSQYRIRAHTPWQRNDAPGEERKDGHPTQQVAYACDRDCLHSPLSLPYAADVTPPAAVDCRCGGTARRDGAPAGAEPSYPKYGTGGKGERDQADVTPWAQLMKRRETPELEANLAEAMERLSLSRVAR